MAIVLLYVVFFFCLFVFVNVEVGRLNIKYNFVALGKRRGRGMEKVKLTASQESQTEQKRDGGGTRTVPQY